MKTVILQYIYIYTHTYIYVYVYTHTHAWEINVINVTGYFTSSQKNKFLCTADLKMKFLK